MRIELHIDRVVLNGVGDPWQAEDIREALHAELTRLVTAAPPSTWQKSRVQRRIVAPTVRPAPGGTPSSLGRGIAQSVHSGVAGERGGRK